MGFVIDPAHDWALQAAHLYTAGFDPNLQAVVQKSSHTLNCPISVFE